MPAFGKESLDRLTSCHIDLQKLFNEVIKHVDCTILVGHRGKDDQDKAFAGGKSKLPWPNSKHNSHPSLAVDVAIYPVDWNNIPRFIYFAGYVKGLADSMGIKIRWGGDWNRNYNPSDESFRDLVHFELE